MNRTDVEIVEFEGRYAADFAGLNYEWIEKYFVIEDHDREMLDNPFENIIDPGGRIFFARVDQKIVGTVALIVADNNRFELAKMAVVPGFRGKGIGDRLIEACIEYARIEEKSSIFLLSNTLLEPAINLYRKHGFVETLFDERTPYQRVNIRMELALSKTAM